MLRSAFLLGFLAGALLMSIAEFLPVLLSSHTIRIQNSTLVKILERSRGELGANPTMATYTVNLPPEFEGNPQKAPLRVLLVDVCFIFSQLIV